MDSHLAFLSPSATARRLRCPKRTGSRFCRHRRFLDGYLGTDGHILAVFPVVALASLGVVTWAAQRSVLPMAINFDPVIPVRPTVASPCLVVEARVIDMQGTATHGASTPLTVCHSYGSGVVFGSALLGAAVADFPPVWIHVDRFFGSDKVFGDGHALHPDPARSVSRTSTDVSARWSRRLRRRYSTRCSHVGFSRPSMLSAYRGTPCGIRLWDHASASRTVSMAHPLTTISVVNRKTRQPRIAAMLYLLQSEMNPLGRV